MRKIKRLNRIGLITMTASALFLATNTNDTSAKEKEAATGYFYTNENLSIYEEDSTDSKVLGAIAPQQVQLKEKTDEGYYLIDSSKGPAWIKPTIEEKTSTILISNGAKLYKSPSSYMYLGAGLSSQYQNITRQYGDWVEMNSWVGKVWLNKADFNFLSNEDAKEELTLTTASTPLYYFPSEKHLSSLHLAPQTVTGFQKTTENGDWMRVYTWVGPMWLKTDFNKDINEVCDFGDTYCNWEQLRYNHPVGKDLRIQKRDIQSDVIISAIHGGGIEVGTTEIADAIAGDTYKYYSLEGMLATNNNLLHLTSTQFDEPIALSMHSKSERSVSIHGMSGTKPVTYIGGMDIELKDTIRKHLELNGFEVVEASSEIAGVKPNNIANKTSLNKGVQLELSTGQRKAFFVDGNWLRAARTKPANRTPEFHLYKEAVQNALIEFKANLN